MTKKDNSKEKNGLDRPGKRDVGSHDRRMGVPEASSRKAHTPHRSGRKDL